MQVYERVVSASRQFLGPGTERFIQRQLRAHLKTDPQNLKANQLPQLANWMEASATLLLSEDKAQALRKAVEGLA